MAITKIFKITTTPFRAIKYAENDKYEVNELDKSESEDIVNSISYATRDKTELVNDKVELLTYKTLSSYNICSSENAVEIFRQCKLNGFELNRSKQKLSKNGEVIVAYHLFQSFDADEKMPAHVANEIGLKLAHEVFGNYPCVVSTHTNTDNIHNHIIICAWDITGHKWNDDIESKRLIRKVSDRLCEENGLNVLYKTKDLKVVKYRDKNGKQRLFEPTDRKIKLAQERKLGEIVGDVNDYRNSDSYETQLNFEVTNRNKIKDDIDNLLPFVTSYDDLLDKLRDNGYTVNDKKKNGEWLKYVTFTAPSHERGTRDYKIGDGTFYTREALTLYIDELYRNRNLNKPTHGEYQNSEQPPSAVITDHVDYYDYSTIDIEQIDEDRRLTKDQNGACVYIKRNEVEKTIVQDIKRTDLVIHGLIDTTGIQRIIEEQKNTKKNKGHYSLKTREEQLINQIQESFENLHFVEQKGIFSYGQINSLYKSIYEQFNATLTQLTQAEKLVTHFKTILNIPDMVRNLEEKIDIKKSDDEYMFESYPDDSYTLKQMKNTLKQYKINTEAGIENLTKKIMDASKRIEDIKVRLVGFQDEIGYFERCVRVLDRIDTEHNRRNIEAIEQFNILKTLNENQTKITNTNRLVR